MDQMSGSQILIVDDTKENIELLSMFFRKFGYKCISANSGEESIKVTDEQNNIDLILMDVKMKGMSGIEAMKKIKDKQDIPIIAVTAYASKEDRDKMINEGFDDYISKPVDFNDLKNLINTWIEK